jgi:hypothetical protein
MRIKRIESAKLGFFSPSNRLSNDQTRDSSLWTRSFRSSTCRSVIGAILGMKRWEEDLTKVAEVSGARVELREDVRWREMRRDKVSKATPGTMPRGFRGTLAAAAVRARPAPNRMETRITRCRAATQSRRPPGRAQQVALDTTAAKIIIRSSESFPRAPNFWFLSATKLYSPGLVVKRDVSILVCRRRQSCVSKVNRKRSCEQMSALYDALDALKDCLRLNRKTTVHYQ